MFVGRVTYFFVLYAGVIVIYKMTEASEKDVYSPNSVLKKNIPSLKIRRTLYVLIISFFIYGLGFHFVSDMPRLVNRDFVTGSGEIREITEIKENKYDVTLENDGKIKSYSDIYGDNLSKGDEVTLVCPPNPLYVEMVMKNNDGITELYQKYYDSNLSEKVCVFFYCFFNLVIQEKQIRKMKGKAVNRLQRWLYVLWKTGLYLFTFTLLVSLADVIDNYIMGIFAGVSYVAYNMAYMIRKLF